MKSGHHQLAHRKGFDFLSTQPIFKIVRQVGLIASEAVRIGKKTRRGHLAYEGISDVRSIIGDNDDAEESVTSVNCAVSICDVNNEQDRV